MPGIQQWSQCFQYLSKVTLLPSLSTRQTDPPLLPPTLHSSPAAGFPSVPQGFAVPKLCSHILAGYYWLDKAPHPKHCHFLTLEICRYVILHGREDFADGMSESWDGDIILDYPSGDHLITRLLLRGRQEGRVGEGGVVTGEGEVKIKAERSEDAVLLALKMQGGATSQGQQASLEVGKGQEIGSPLRHLGGTQPVDTLILEFPSSRTISN